MTNSSTMINSTLIINKNIHNGSCIIVHNIKHIMYKTVINDPINKQLVVCILHFDQKYYFTKSAIIKKTQYPFNK